MRKSKLRQHLSQTCSDQELKQWFDPLLFVFDETARHVSITFPHPFFGQWFEESHKDRFEEQLLHFLGPGHQLRYSYSAHASAGHARGNGNGSAVNPVATMLDYPFGRQFTFDRFLVNKKNTFPVASAREVASGSDSAYNPFVICGETGSGKTHLIKSLGNDLARTHGRERIFSGTVEDLGHVYGSRFPKDPHQARSFLMSHDFLMVDDFHLIKDAPRLQEELIILFNQFYDSGKQMVFSCSGKLTSYGFLNPVLKSRLEWGLIVHLKRPDLEVRLKYVQEQCRAKRIRLSKEQMLTLAQRFEDFRYLQGILLKLSAYKKIMSREIQSKDFDQVLSNTEAKAAPSLEPEDVIRTVADHFRLSPREITGNKRHHRIVLARQASMFLCRQIMGSSYPLLGRIFGGKDHSTAMYSVRKISQLSNENKEIKELVTLLKKKCLENAQE